ncbi:MAG: putative baseplate assembly protein [Kineosporiaceae bacterium]|nr:putative baseplate assembly protein [Kineosporiaceae bacterium]
MTVQPPGLGDALRSRRGRIVPPDLDDRTWQQLVDELRGLIPHYAPQWTDHSPSDLGITLLELFAWLTEGTIYRLNRTPEKNYVAFLNLLGITRDPATPAQTFLTFTPGAVPVVVPAGSQAQTSERAGHPIVFETDEEVEVLPSTLTAALLVGPHPVGAAAGTYTDVTATLVGPPTGNQLISLEPRTEALLCLGFDQVLDRPLGLGVRLSRALQASEDVELQVTLSTGTLDPLAWVPAGATSDGTDRLHRDGRITVTPPPDWATQHATGDPADEPWSSVKPAAGTDGPRDPLAWIGIRIANTRPLRDETGQPVRDANGREVLAPIAIGIDRLLFNSASARTALTIRAPEELGTANGTPFQVFELAHRPLFRRPAATDPYDHVRVQVGTGTPPVWEDWTAVRDLPPGAGKVYRLDPVTGELVFGNHDPATGSGHGSVPPLGSRIRAVSYRHVGAGSAGDVDPGRVTVLASTLTGAQVTGVGGVRNLGPGRGGGDEEPIEDTLRRAPAELKIRDRAVTAEDYEFLALEPPTGLRIARALTPRLQTADGPGPAPLPWVKGDPWAYAGIIRAPGVVTVIVVPDQGPDVARPEPTPDQLRDVQAHLEPRRDLTAHLAVTGPRYLPVAVDISVVIWRQAIDAGATVEAITGQILAKVKRFLHPTSGGPAGTGWRIGQHVFSSDLFAAVKPSDDLGYISSIQVQPDIPAYHFPPLNPGGTPTNYVRERERPALPFALGASVRVADYELVCAAADPLLVITPSVVAQ